MALSLTQNIFSAFVSTLCAQLMLSGEREIDKKFLFSVLVSPLAAGLSTVMNTKSGGEEIE